jgi:hypothetical protein
VSSSHKLRVLDLLHEKAAWESSGLQDIEDLAFALLNCQQFIFVP